MLSLPDRKNPDVLFLSDSLPTCLHKQKSCLGPAAGLYYNACSFSQDYTLSCDIHTFVIFTNVKKILNTKNGFRKNGNFGLLMAEQMSQKAQQNYF